MESGDARPCAPLEFITTALNNLIVVQEQDASESIPHAGHDGIVPWGLGVHATRTGGWL